MLNFFNKKQWLYILVSLGFIFAQVWLDLKLPDYMANVTTLVQTEGSDMANILLQGGYMMLCALGSILFSVVVGYLAAKVAAGLSQTLRNRVYDKTMDFSMEEIDRFSTASLINRTTNDIMQIQNLVAMGLQAIIKAPIMAVWAIMKIAGKSWQWMTATAAAVMFLVTMLAVTLIFALPRFKRIQTLTDNLNRVTREHLTGIRVVRAYNAESYQERKFAKANDEATRNNLIANRVMALMFPTMTLISSGLTLAVYWIGAYLIETAALTDRLSIFSDMVVFSNYAMQIIMAFMLLNLIFILLPRAQVSANRICEVLDTESRILDGSGTRPDSGKRGMVEFRHVSFRYPGAAGDTLTDIDFTASPGETVAFIGSTGCGKTSLINLIPRFYDVSAGQVLVDGVDVRDYRQSELHDRIGYATQKAVLFSGTVASNVTHGESAGHTITLEDVKEAIAVAQGTDFVEQMDGAYNAPIAQSGTNVSGGQKQRLSIARAIARKPEILIFDDSFSALDYRTDRSLRQALRDSTAQTTKLIVAQRIGTIRSADQIIVLDGGKIVGKGTHDELLRICPTYQEIASSQLSKEELQGG